MCSLGLPIEFYFKGFSSLMTLTFQISYMGPLYSPLNIWANWIQNWVMYMHWICKIFHPMFIEQLLKNLGLVSSSSLTCKFFFSFISREIRNSIKWKYNFLIPITKSKGLQFLWPCPCLTSLRWQTPWKIDNALK